MINKKHEAETDSDRAENKRREIERARDALVETLTLLRALPETLRAYEATGDHDHSTSGTRPIPVGGRCPGGDCLVAEARAILEALQEIGI